MRKLYLLGDIMRFRQINFINDGQFFQIRPVGLRKKCTQTCTYFAFCYPSTVTIKQTLWGNLYFHSSTTEEVWIGVMLYLMCLIPLNCCLCA